MDDAQTPSTEVPSQKPRSIAAAVEKLFEGAAHALDRAASCNDPEWQKDYLGQAAAYKEWAVQMEPVAILQARIDDRVEMLRRRLKLPAPTATRSCPTAAECSAVLHKAPSLGAAASDPADLLNEPCGMGPKRPDSPKPAASDEVDTDSQ